MQSGKIAQVMCIDLLGLHPIKCKDCCDWDEVYQITRSQRGWGQTCNAIITTRRRFIMAIQGAGWVTLALQILDGWLVIHSGRPTCVVYKFNYWSTAQIFQIFQKLNNFSLPNILGLQYRGEPNTCWAEQWYGEVSGSMLSMEVWCHSAAWWHWSQTSCMVAPVTLVALFLAQLHVCSMQMGSWSQLSHLLANGRPTQIVY